MFEACSQVKITGIFWQLSLDMNVSTGEDDDLSMSETQRSDVQLSLQA